MTLQLPTPNAPQFAVENQPRFLQSDDVAALAAFDTKMFPYSHIPKPYENSPEGYWGDQAENHSTQTEVIMVAGRVAAYMHVKLNDSELQPGRQFADLLAVAVDPEYRLQGVATFLAARAMRRAVEDHQVVGFRIFGELGTPMINWAERLGFTVPRQLPKYRTDPEGAMHIGHYLTLHVPQS